MFRGLAHLSPSPSPSPVVSTVQRLRLRLRGSEVRAGCAVSRALRTRAGCRPDRDERCRGDAGRAVIHRLGAPRPAGADAPSLRRPGPASSALIGCHRAAGTRAEHFEKIARRPPPLGSATSTEGHPQEGEGEGRGGGTQCRTIRGFTPGWKGGKLTHFFHNRSNSE